MAFAGLRQPAQFRVVMRAHVIAWRERRRWQTRVRWIATAGRLLAKFKRQLSENEGVWFVQLRGVAECLGEALKQYTPCSKG